MRLANRSSDVTTRDLKFASPASLPIHGSVPIKLNIVDLMASCTLRLVVVVNRNIISAGGTCVINST